MTGHSGLRPFSNKLIMPKFYCSGPGIHTLINYCSEFSYDYTDMWIRGADKIDNNYWLFYNHTCHCLRYRSEANETTRHPLVIEGWT